MYNSHFMIEARTTYLEMDKGLIKIYWGQRNNRSTRILLRTCLSNAKRHRDRIAEHKTPKPVHNYFPILVKT
jgi:hypothetical protein